MTPFWRSSRLGDFELMIDGHRRHFPDQCLSRSRGNPAARTVTLGAKRADKNNSPMSRFQEPSSAQPLRRDLNRDQLDESRSAGNRRSVLTLVLLRWTSSVLRLRPVAERRRDAGASRKERPLRLTGCCPCPSCWCLRPCHRALRSTPRRCERIQKNPAVLKAARTILTGIRRVKNSGDACEVAKTQHHQCFPANPQTVWRGCSAQFAALHRDARFGRVRNGPEPPQIRDPVGAIRVAGRHHARRSPAVLAAIFVLSAAGAPPAGPCPGSAARPRCGHRRPRYRPSHPGHSSGSTAEPASLGVRPEAAGWAAGGPGRAAGAGGGDRPAAERQPPH